MGKWSNAASGYSQFRHSLFARVRRAPLAEQNKNIYKVCTLESVWKALKKPVGGWYAETLRH